MVTVCSSSVLSTGLLKPDFPFAFLERSYPGTLPGRMDSLPSPHSDSSSHLPQFHEFGYQESCSLDLDPSSRLWGQSWREPLALCRAYPRCILVPRRLGPGCQLCGLLWLLGYRGVFKCPSLASKRVAPGSTVSSSLGCHWMFDISHLRTHEFS